MFDFVYICICKDMLLLERESFRDMDMNKEIKGNENDERYMEFIMTGWL